MGAEEIETEAKPRPNGVSTDHSDGRRGCRDVDAAVRELDGVTAAAVHRAAGETATDSAVPDEYDRVVFEVAGLDCRTCAGLVETALMRLDAVSNTTASHRYGSVRVDYDPSRTDVDAMREELADLGYPVETTDQAFANRRAKQWADARFAAGIMAGLMVVTPYAGVIYPTRFGFWFYDPRVVELLERALNSIFATHFFLNIAVLTGIVLLFTGKPILDEATTAVRELSPNVSLVVASLSTGLYLYSSVIAFWNVSGGIYYDVVIALIVGTTIARQSTVDVAESTTDREAPEPTTGFDGNSSESVDIATDGGRE